MPFTLEVRVLKSVVGEVVQIPKCENISSKDFINLQSGPMQ